MTAGDPAGVLAAPERVILASDISRKNGGLALVTPTEHSLETYRFSCTYCTHDWHQDYRRRETTERDGTCWIVHYRDGIPAENPTAAVFQCPGCGHNTIAVRRVAHHLLPEQTPRS